MTLNIISSLIHISCLGYIIYDNFRLAKRNKSLTIKIYLNEFLIKVYKSKNIRLQKQLDSIKKELTELKKD